MTIYSLYFQTKSTVIIGGQVVFPHKEAAAKTLVGRCHPHPRTQDLSLLPIQIPMLLIINFKEVVSIYIFSGPWFNKLILFEIAENLYMCDA